MNQGDPTDADLVDRKLREIKNKRFIAPWIVVGIIVSAILAWIVGVSENARKIVEMLRPGRTYERVAYDLAKNVAFASEFEIDKARANSPDIPADIHRMMNQRFSEMGNELNDLGITVDYRSLDYASTAGFMRSSPAAYFLAAQVEKRGGKRARQAFEAGLDVWSTYFQAVNKEFTVSDSGIGSGWSAQLDVLKADARRVGVQSDLKPTDRETSDSDSLNTWMRVEVGELGDQIEERLKN